MLGSDNVFSTISLLTIHTFVVFFLLGDSPASEFYVPMLRNTLFQLHGWCKQELNHFRTYLETCNLYTYFMQFMSCTEFLTLGSTAIHFTQNDSFKLHIYAVYTK